MKSNIVGVGNVAYDYLFIVEKYPQEDSSARISDAIEQGGGCVATALVAASRLGIPTSFICNIGDDEAGKRIYQGLLDENINLQHMEIIPGGRSQTSYVMINPANQSRTKFPYKDKLPNIVWTQDKIDQIKNASVLHLDGTQYDNAIAAAKIAKEYNVPVSLDGCSRKDDNSLNVELAKLTDILIMNNTFPFYTSNKETLEEAMEFFAHIGPRIVITTLGDQGCVAWIDGACKYFPAFKVDAIDTTGAGDAFHGGFLAAQLKGYDLETSIYYASAVSALKCLQIGGRTGLPTHDTVIQFLSEKGEI